MNPLISIIVPIYNIETYLSRCIDSILNQTYQNMEVLLIDDGSSDGSTEICDEFAKMDERVTVIHQKNGGLSSARNCGIDASHGEYIMFVDGDDYIEPDMCEKLHFALLQNKSEIAVCSINHEMEDGEAVLSMNDAAPLFDGTLDREEYFLKMLGAGYWYWIVAWNKLYRKELFEHVQYPPDKLHEDEFVIHRLIFNCTKIAVISDRLYHYVQRSGSIMNKEFSVKRLDVMEAFLDRENFYIDHGVNSEIIIKNFSWCTNELGNMFHKIDHRQPGFAQRYKELYHQYRAAAKRVLIFQMTMVQRCYFTLSCAAPYFARKAAAYYRKKQNRRTPDGKK